VRPIYLDYNATTPVDPAVLEAMLPYLREQFGNPSSAHAYGAEARRAVESARAQVAELIRSRPEEIVFTSGGSESNNMVLRGVAASSRIKGEIVTSAVEHPAILEPVAALAAEGFRATILPVSSTGRVDPAAARGAITGGTILVTIMLANNEVGTIEPVESIAAAARERGVPVHTDAAQAAGKIPVEVDRLGVDYLTIAGHKLYAPKGVGALYVRSGRALPRMIHGASHESGRRAGTENVPGIVGLGAACAIAAARLQETARHSREMRERLWAGLSSRLSEIRRNGDPEASLPNTLSVSLRGIDAGALLSAVGGSVAASPGAACHSEKVEISSVLKAMGVPADWAMGTLRFSTGRSTTPEEIDDAAEIVAEAARRMGATAR
jgi:cysteine desulfurase